MFEEIIEFGQTTKDIKDYLIRLAIVGIIIIFVISGMSVDAAAVAITSLVYILVQPSIWFWITAIIITSLLFAWKLGLFDNL